MKVAEFLLNSPMLYLLAGSSRGRLELTGRGIFSSSTKSISVKYRGRTLGGKFHIFFHHEGKEKKWNTEWYPLNSFLVGPIFFLGNPPIIVLSLRRQMWDLVCTAPHCDGQQMSGAWTERLSPPDCWLQWSSHSECNYLCPPVSCSKAANITGLSLLYQRHFSVEWRFNNTFQMAKYCEYLLS